MKQSALSFLFLLIVLSSRSQNLKVSKEVIRDFSVSYYYKYRFEKNQTLRAWAYWAGNKLGLGVADLELAVERMETNATFREELYKTFAEFCKYDSELLTMSLISVGMKASNAKELTTYILDKYRINSTTLGQSNKKEKESTFVLVQESEFIGGPQAMNQYLRESLRYPDSAIKEEIQAIITVNFSIDKDGSVKNVYVNPEDFTKGYGLPEEAIRVVSEMPKWKPAMAEGKPMISRKKLPIIFRFERDKANSQDSKITTIGANKTNVPKAIFRSVDNKILDSSKTLVSKRRYCATDSLNPVYTVEIIGDRIIIKYVYEDFNETVQGTIKEGKIYTNDRLEIQDKHLAGKIYLIESELLKVFNPEGGGGYNTFKLCK